MAMNWAYFAGGAAQAASPYLQQATANIHESNRQRRLEENQRIQEERRALENIANSPQYSPQVRQRALQAVQETLQPGYRGGALTAVNALLQPQPPAGPSTPNQPSVPRASTTPPGTPPGTGAGAAVGTGSVGAAAGSAGSAAMPPSTPTTTPAPNGNPAAQVAPPTPKAGVAAPVVQAPPAAQAAPVPQPARPAPARGSNIDDIDTQFSQIPDRLASAGVQRPIAPGAVNENEIAALVAGPGVTAAQLRDSNYKYSAGRADANKEAQQRAFQEQLLQARTKAEQSFEQREARYEDAVVRSAQIIYQQAQANRGIIAQTDRAAAHNAAAMTRQTTELTAREKQQDSNGVNVAVRRIQESLNPKAGVYLTAPQLAEAKARADAQTQEIFDAYEIKYGEKHPLALAREKRQGAGVGAAPAPVAAPKPASAPAPAPKERATASRVSLESIRRKQAAGQPLTALEKNTLKFGTPTQPTSARMPDVLEGLDTAFHGRTGGPPLKPLTPAERTRIATLLARPKASLSSAEAAELAALNARIPR